MKNVIWLLAVVIAVAFVTQDNFAQKKFREKGKEFREDFKKQLNLTEEQEKKIEQLRNLLNEVGKTNKPPGA